MAHVESHLASNWPRVNVQKLLTRKHSSRMCTDRFSSSWGGGLPNPLPWMQTPWLLVMWKHYLAPSLKCSRSCSYFKTVSFGVKLFEHFLRANASCTLFKRKPYDSIFPKQNWRTHFLKWLNHMDSRNEFLPKGKVNSFSLLCNMTAIMLRGHLPKSCLQMRAWWLHQYSGDLQGGTEGKAQEWKKKTCLQLLE